MNCLYGTFRPMLGIFVLPFTLTLLGPNRGHAIETIYWADNDQRNIGRVTLDGSAPEILATTPNIPIGLAVDQKVGKLYWSEVGNSFDSNGRSRIISADLDGGNQTAIFATTSSDDKVGQIVLDNIRNQLYWIDQQGLLGSIFKMDLGTGHIDQLISNVSDLGPALAIDPLNGHLYFGRGGSESQYQFQNIERMNLDGSGLTTITNNYGYSYELDITNQRIYLANYFANTINRINFDGTHPKTVVQTVASPRDVQVHDDHMYYINYQALGPNQSGPYSFQWIRASLDGTNREVIYEVPRLEGPLDAIQFIVVPELNSTMLISSFMLVVCFGVLVRRVRSER